MDGNNFTMYMRSGMHEGGGPRRRRCVFQSLPPVSFKHASYALVFPGDHSSGCDNSGAWLHQSTATLQDETVNESHRRRECSKTIWKLTVRQAEARATLRELSQEAGHYPLAHVTTAMLQQEARQNCIDFEKV